MKSELKMVKEFRRKRAQMQKELDEVMGQLFSSVSLIPIKYLFVKCSL